MTSKKTNYSAVDRIAEKMRKDDCETATYATQVMTSINQGNKARKPRPKLLTLLIEQYLTDGGEPEQYKVIEYLKSQCGMGIIDSVTDDEIEWTDSNGKIKDTKIYNLNNYICSARKLINTD